MEDTLICEYDGIGTNEAVGKYREWKEYLASGKERIVLLKINDQKQIYYDPGHARYYMDDMGEGIGYEHSFPNASRFTKTKSGTSEGGVSKKRLLNEYGIKLISWDYTHPIKNSFH